MTGSVLLPLLNLVVALCVLGYWVQKWYSYVVRGVTWYLTDQLVPLYALLVAIVALFALSGRLQASWPHWLFFVVHVVTLVAALFFFATFRINRLF